MSTQQRRKRDREAMRRRILDAAKTLFVRKGFDNVSMRGIASAIEYSPAALYRYFRNKREILTALREEGFVRLVASQRELQSAQPDPLERLRVGGRNYVHFAIHEPEYFHLMFCTNCLEVDLEGAKARTSMESFDLFSSTVRQCVDRGDFGEVPVNAAVIYLWSVIHGMAALISSGRVAALTDETDIERLVGQIVDLGLRPCGR